MDSKLVNKEIRKYIWSILRQEGFSKFSPRSAWRCRNNRYEVINFQSFNSYLAEGLGCTTYSFSINLGIYLSYIPYPNLTNHKNRHCPQEYECHLRKRLVRTLIQKQFSRNDIWFIDPSGSNLNEVIQDALDVILTDGLPWFEEFSNDQIVLDTFKNEKESINGSFGFGNNPSPTRSLFLGFTAYKLVEVETARKELENALHSNCFPFLNERIKQCLSELENRN